MTDKAISPLRQRLIDDLAIRRLGPKTRHEYIRRVKGFADFLGRSPAKATAEDVDRYQLRLASIGARVSTVNATASALRFFFSAAILPTRSCRSASLAASPLFSAPKRSVGFSRRRRTSSRRRP